MKWIWVIAVLVAVSAPRAAALGEHDARIQNALQQLADGDTLDAIKTLTHTDLEAIGDPQWYVLLGRLQRERGSIRARLESQRLLEKAAQLFPDDDDVMMELALTYFAQTFYPDAERCFVKCLEIDPGNCRASYKLGVTHYERWKRRVNSYFDEAETARGWLARTIECDSTNLDASRRYVNVLYALNRLDEAEHAARVFAARFPDAPEFPLMVGTVAYDNGRLASADSAYDTALPLLTTEEWTAYASLTRNVLGYEDLATFENASVEEQPVMQRAFWEALDPDPTTEVNERYLEHVHRTFRADVFFSHSRMGTSWTRPQVRGWDTERGEISIKCGWPTNLHASHGGDRYEVWTYASPTGGVSIPFIDEYGSGNLTIPMYSNILAAVRHLDRDTEIMPAGIIFDGAVDAVAFKDDDFHCSVYLCMHTNADSMLARANVSTLKTFQLRARFFDDQWLPEYADTVDIPAHEMAMLPGSRFRIYDVIHSYQLPFGDYHVACALEDDAGRARAVLRGQCKAEHLSRSGLCTSELMFLREGLQGASIVRGGEVLMPNPWRRYGTGQRLGVYFEVYRLALVRGQSRYRVTYEIFEDPDETPGTWDRLGRFVSAFGGFIGLGDEDPALAQSFENSGTEHDARERVAIDIDSLPDGRYRLWVRIDDLQTGDDWETSRSFYKVGLPDVARE